MPKQKVVIVDVGVSNIYNVARGFERIGADVLITADKKAILDAPRLVLPGVGAFGAGIKNLEARELVEPIQTYAKSGKPLLGICLGMQLLMTESSEMGTWKGLDILPGKVVRFESPKNPADYKIPQICWNSIQAPKGDVSIWNNSLLKGLPHPACVYFVHSYRVVPDHDKHIVATTTYGRDNFCSVINRENVTGCQFHPERSGKIGLKILKNFIS